jgi:hypothetical protein
MAIIFASCFGNQSLPTMIFEPFLPRAVAARLEPPLAYGEGSSPQVNGRNWKNEKKRKAGQASATNAHEAIATIDTS